MDYKKMVSGVDGTLEENSEKDNSHVDHACVPKKQTANQNKQQQQKLQ